MNIQLQTLDWCIIGFFFAVTVLIGVVVSKRAGKSEEEFFLGGRGMPWWLLGFSMVATTFSTDTPNLVTDIVRANRWRFRQLGVVVYAAIRDADRVPLCAAVAASGSGHGSGVL